MYRSPYGPKPSPAYGYLADDFVEIEFTEYQAFKGLLGFIDFYKRVIGTAKGVLSNVKDKIMEHEKNHKFERDEAANRAKTDTQYPSALLAYQYYY